MTGTPALEVLASVRKAELLELVGAFTEPSPPRLAIINRLALAALHMPAVRNALDDLDDLTREVAAGITDPIRLVTLEAELLCRQRSAGVLVQ